MAKWHMLRFLTISLVLTGFLTVPATAQTGGAAPWPKGEPAQRRASPLDNVRSWGYQLQKAEPETVAASPFDLVVIDYSRSGDDEGRFTRAEVARMQVKPDGRRRIVLAYLSIGEAENYRFYWDPAWVEAFRVSPERGESEPAPAVDAKTDRAAGPRRPQPRLRTLHFPRLTAPVWLGRENETWSGNFFVRYWDKDWQSIIFGQRTGYLERIIDAGFDGVYLDRVDAFDHAEDGRPKARAEMVRFVTALARHARRLKPGFLIVPQNGEELLGDSAYVAAIDGIAKEDLLYGQSGDGQRNSEAIVTSSIDTLMEARTRGLPVLVVEYVLDKASVKNLRTEIEGYGFVPYFGVRSLDRLVLPSEFETPANVPRPPAATLPPAQKR
jgi:cysteinyl-tRNA synthetase